MLSKSTRRQKFELIRRELSIAWTTQPPNYELVGRLNAQLRVLLAEDWEGPIPLRIRRRRFLNGRKADQ